MSVHRNIFFITTLLYAAVNAQNTNNKLYQLKIEQNGCSCLSNSMFRLPRQLTATINTADVIPHMTSYDCSCNMSVDSDKQKRDLQNMLDNIVKSASNSQKCTCEVNLPSSSLSTYIKEKPRQRRAYFLNPELSRWQCNCGDIMSFDTPFYYKDYNVKRAPAYYWSVMPSNRFYLQPISKSSRKTVYQYPTTKTKLKDQPVEQKKGENEESIKEKEAKKSTEKVLDDKQGQTTGADEKTCPCFDIVLTFQRNPTEGDTATKNGKASNDSPNCICRQQAIPNTNDNINHQWQYQLIPTIDSAGESQQKYYGDEITSSTKEATVSVPCIYTLQFNNDQQKQEVNKPASYCTCQKDYIPCAENLCCQSLKAREANDLQKARSSMDLLMGVLSKIRDEMSR